MRRLTSQQMAEVALEALANARRLCDDAMSLRRANRLPSALMLAGLAADEMGKHVLVSSFYAREGTDKEWRTFWRRFRRHESKLGDALIGAWIGDLMSEDLPPDVAGFHQERLLATYVDVASDGAVTVPARTVTLGRVDQVLSMIETELVFCESMMAKVAPGKLADVLDSMRAWASVREMRQLVSDGGSEAAMAFAISARLGMSREQALGFARQAKDIFEGRRLATSDLRT